MRRNTFAVFLSKLKKASFNHSPHCFAKILKINQEKFLDKVVSQKLSNRGFKIKLRSLWSNNIGVPEKK